MAGRIDGTAVIRTDSAGKHCLGIFVAITLVALSVAFYGTPEAGRYYLDRNVPGATTEKAATASLEQGSFATDSSPLARPACVPVWIYTWGGITGLWRYSVSSE